MVECLVSHVLGDTENLVSFVFLVTQKISFRLLLVTRKIVVFLVTRIVSAGVIGCRGLTRAISLAFLVLVLGDTRRSRFTIRTVVVLLLEDVRGTPEQSRRVKIEDRRTKIENASSLF